MNATHENKKPSDEAQGQASLGSVTGSDASIKPKMSDGELADRLMHVLMNEMQYKSDCFDYLCWLEETHQSENVKGADFLVMASDGTTCWGKTYSDAVKVAMHHDKELYDAVKDFVPPEDEHQNA
jgi:hypothetical protein